MVDTTPRRFPSLNRRRDDLYHVGCLTDVIFNVSRVNINSETDDKDIFLLVIFKFNKLYIYIYPLTHS